MLPHDLEVKTRGLTWRVQCLHNRHMTWIIAFLLKALVIFLIARLVPGVRLGSYGAAVGVAAVYALLSMLLKWLLVILSFPLILVTFGLFLFVLNGFLLWLTDKLLDSFEIKNFPALAVTTVLMTLGNVLVDGLVARL